jgi:hypothetical protein
LSDQSTPSISFGFLWRIMRWLNPRLQSRFQSGDKPSELVLMLSTTGRKTGNIHKTPLGPKADWYRNILSNPKVRVSVGGKEFPAIAEPITAAGQIADFIELRLKRRRWMIKILMRMEGLAFNHTREELEEFARQKAIVVLHPLN